MNLDYSEQPMKIESVDLFYLAMPVIRDIGDGSQDALLVRIEAGGYTGWGECEASPLVSLASWVCPMSHSACKPVNASVLGQELNDVTDIHRINALVRENSYDLLQADHTLSGIDIALWDLLGRRLGEPVYRLLGYERAFPKTPYASQLFGSDPHETYQCAVRVREMGYRAAKFGWGPYGRSDAETDRYHVEAARGGLGDDVALFVDAGTVWGEDVGKARARLAALEANRVGWLEEPFACGALDAHRQLAAETSIPLAAGEGCHNIHQARTMIDHAGLGFIQIDAGRIGGITVAKRAADYARGRNVRYVNHTFTTQLALSASLQPYAGLDRDVFCECPAAPSDLARALTKETLNLDENGQIHLSERPGLGMTVDLDAVAKYAVDAEIRIGGRLLYKTPELNGKGAGGAINAPHIEAVRSSAAGANP